MTGCQWGGDMEAAEILEEVPGDLEKAEHVISALYPAELVQ